MTFLFEKDQHFCRFTLICIFRLWKVIWNELTHKRSRLDPVPFCHTHKQAFPKSTQSLRAVSCGGSTSFFVLGLIWEAVLTEIFYHFPHSLFSSLHLNVGVGCLCFKVYTFHTFLLWFSPCCLLAADRLHAFPKPQPEPRRLSWCANRSEPSLLLYSSVATVLSRQVTE